MRDCNASNKQRIAFEFVDEFDNIFKSSSDFELFSGETVPDRIGEYLNTFLSQCGYVRKNDYIFMEDLTFDELEAVAYFLEDYRLDKKEHNNEED